jgi:hypothetical protein
MTTIKYIFYFSIITVLLSSCQADGNFTGREYSPQMYHPVGYEPLSLITKDGISSGIIEQSYYTTNSLPYNDYNGKTPINVRYPVPNTIKRQNFVSVTGSISEKPTDPIFIYDLHKDSIELASKILTNPLPVNDKIVEEGKALYLSYCAPCHGENGDGKGKVGGVYKGVPNYATGRYATMTEGHIFHVITHGRNRMWAHKGQIEPEDRWKIVRYVQKLQTKS